jgi:hypothetical protein
MVLANSGFLPKRSSPKICKVNKLLIFTAKHKKQYRLYISYQINAQISFYSYNITALYMFRAILCSSSGGHIVYRVSREERTYLRESVPYVKIYRYNPKHLYPKLNGYGDNGQRKVCSSSAFHSMYLPAEVLSASSP